MTIVLLEYPAISEGDVEAMEVLCSDYLRDSEVVSGTPTGAEQTTSDLTIGTCTLNASAVTRKGKSHAANTVITVPIQGQLAATGSYTVLVTFSTDASRTKKVLCKFPVDPGA